MIRVKVYHFATQKLLASPGYPQVPPKDSYLSLDEGVFQVRSVYFLRDLDVRIEVEPCIYTRPPPRE